MKLLILGGTTEATALAAALAGRDDLRPVLSLAGRTARPTLPPIPHRIGGFGGVAGLVGYLAGEGVSAVIDATHPFAAPHLGPCRRGLRGPRRAAAGLHPPALAARSRRPLDGRRGPRRRGAGARRGTPARAADGGPARTRGLPGGAAASVRHPHHRSPGPRGPAARPPAGAGARPLRLAAETALLREEAIDVLVTKNSGGAAAAAKLDAARALGIIVVAVARPAVAGPRREAFALDDVLAWIDARAHAEPRP